MEGTYKYLASAGADQVVCAKPAVLHRIIVGKDVLNAVIEVSDHASDGDGNVKIYLAGNTLLGVYECEIYFPVGICVDLTNQTNVTFVFSPRI